MLGKMQILHFFYNRDGYTNVLDSDLREMIIKQAPIIGLFQYTDSTKFVMCFRVFINAYLRFSVDSL